MNEIKLQYQTSDGRWIDCEGGYDGKQEDRTEEFLTRCEKMTGKTRTEVIELLQSGAEVRNHKEDWYSNCRDKITADKLEAERTAKALANRDYPDGLKLDCGHVVYYKLHIMGTSHGTSCSCCYDRMSDWN